MQLPFSTPVEIETRLKSREVYNRLREAVGPQFSLFHSLSGYEVSGLVKPEGCRLTAVTFSRNSFKRELRLKFIDVPAGTRLVGGFRLAPAVSAFMAVWFFGVGSFFVIGLSASTSHPWSSADWQMKLQPALMMLFGVLLVSFGLWLSSRSEPKVIDFINEVLSTPDNSDRPGSVAGGILIRPKHERFDYFLITTSSSPLTRDDPAASGLAASGTFAPPLQS